MITFVRTATALPGKAIELLAFAREIAAVVKNASGAQLTVGATVGGANGEVAWIANYENLAHLEEAFVKLMASAEYRDAIKKVEHLAVPGSSRDQIWRHI
jgi:hypothetical protein